MEEVEIPQYFVCPISLQMMKDPVTAVTGITYDRESIEKWLSTGISCPVTKQPIPKDSELTPNHTLRRLIQAWCLANTNNGIERISTPKFPIDKSIALKLVRDLKFPQLELTTLKKIESLALENEKNKKYISEAGATKAVGLFIVKCFKENRFENGIDEALNILRLVWTATDQETKCFVNENHDFIDCLTWVLQFQNYNCAESKTHAILVLKMAIGLMVSNRLERLKPQFFKTIIKVFRDCTMPQQATKAALHVLIEACPHGRNRTRIIDAGAVFELIELELKNPEKRVTELVFHLLSHLCGTADGRSQVVGHAGGIAMVSKKIFRVSPGTDHRAVQILSQIARYSGTKEVLVEMLRVGAVTKLCMVMQSDSAECLRNKAREVLRLHNNVWSNSPCISVYLLTRYTR